MYRLFAALPIPPDLKPGLIDLQDDLPGARWRPPENFHITLCFYGEVSNAQARDLDDLLGEISMAAFEISIEGAGWFGRREPTAVWARVRESDALRALASQCERAARRLGIALDRHPFTPHVTLAYLHSTPLEEARRWVEARQSFRADPFEADVFHLYSSHSGKGASRYISEADYPLARFIAPEGTY